MQEAMNSRLANFALYQVGWLLCVVGAARGWPQRGAMVALVLVGVHLALARQRRVEAVLLAVALCWGLAVETLQIRAVGLRYAGSHGAWPPLWILVLWIQFASTLRFGFSWLSGRYVLTVMLGAIGGPMAFWAGARLGAVEFEHGLVPSLVALGATWAVGMPLLVWVASQLGQRPGSYRGIG